jgi:hypothetical protein
VGNVQVEGVGELVEGDFGEGRVVNGGAVEDEVEVIRGCFLGGWESGGKAGGSEVAGEGRG